MPTTLSIRLSEEDAARLDRLAIAWRAYYIEQGRKMPAAAHLAREVTRSSALRDLLLAWEHGFAPPDVPRLRGIEGP